MFKKSILCIL